MKKAIPSDLKKAGRALFRWLVDNFEVDGTQPLMLELCRLSDRLEQVRAEIATGTLTDADGKRNPLLDSEVKLSGQFMRVWRTLGLATDDKPKNPVGRPCNADRGKY